MPASRRPLAWSLQVLAFLGFLVAFYLTLTHYRGTVPNCYLVKGCDAVQTSSYSAILGVPIALFGTAYFAVLFYLGIALLTGVRRAVTSAYKALTFAGALAAVPLFLLQAAVLHAFCTYCIAVEAILLLTWAGSLALPGGSRDRGTFRPRVAGNART